MRRKTLFKNFFSDEMEWLSHDYEKGGVVNISAMDTYSGMELCTLQKFWMTNHFRKISKLTMDTSLNKAQYKQELLCG
jgi:hypothetical protein